MTRQPLSLLAIAAGLALAALASGCAGTETGNPFEGELRVDAHSSDPARVAIAAGGEVVVTEAWVATGPVELIAEAECDDEQGAADMPPDFGTADHAAAGVRLARFELAEDDYCRALVPLVIAAAPLPAGAPPELEGSSIVLVGEVTATGTPFRLVSSLDGAVDVRAVAGSFRFGPEEPALFLGFDVAAWFDGVDLAGAELDIDGVALVDGGTNSDLLNAFEENLARGIEIYRDLDRDGSVDPPDDALVARGQ